MLTIEDQEIRFRKLFNKLQLSEQLISAMLGGVVVVIVIFFILNYVKEVKRGERITSEAAATVNEALLAREQEITSSVQDQIYTVQVGDDLSVIAEKFYGDKGKWVEIVKANELLSPDQIQVGQELVIPGVSIESSIVDGEASAAAVLTASSIERFTEDKYTVKLGDTLEMISLKAYGVKDRWSEILQANNLYSGDHLDVGQELVIPRN